MKKIFLFAMQATLFLVFGTTEGMHRRGAVKMHARKNARRPSDEKGQDVRRERTGNDDAIARALRKSRRGVGGQQLALDDVPAVPTVRSVGCSPSSGSLRLSGNKGVLSTVLMMLLFTTNVAAWGSHPLCAEVDPTQYDGPCTLQAGQWTTLMGQMEELGDRVTRAEEAGQACAEQQAKFTEQQAKLQRDLEVQKQGQANLAAYASTGFSWISSAPCRSYRDDRDRPAKIGTLLAGQGFRPGP